MMKRFFAVIALTAGLMSGSAVLAQTAGAEFRYSVTKLEGNALTVECSAMTASQPPETHSKLNPVAILYRLHRGLDSSWQALTLTQSAGLTQGGTGTGRDPSRWYKTFTAEIPDDLRTALESGRAIHEWYIAYGNLGGTAALSDFQDPGRKLDFTDATLWTADEGSAAAGRTEADVKALGEHTAYHLTVMGNGNAEASWRIVNGSVGVNSPSGTGQLGAQLLNVSDLGDSYANAARLESPEFPDGVSGVVFEAMATKTGDEQVPLLLQYQVDSGAWTTFAMTADNTAVADPEDAGSAVAFVPGNTVDGSVALSGAFCRYTVSLGDVLPPNRSARFRLVRAAYQHIASENACETTCVVRNLRVRSAAPSATVTRPEFQVTGQGRAAEPSTLDDFQVSFRLSDISTAPAPTGYTGTLSLSRRGDDLNAQTVVREMSAAISGGQVTLSANFVARELAYSADGNANVEDGAFFVEKGMAVGLLPNVYDLTLDLGVTGSYLAGRTSYEARETVTTRYTGHSDSAELAAQPYTLEVRENRTKQRTVAVEASVLDQTGSTPRISVLSFPCEPISKEDEPDSWRVLLPKRLPEGEYDGYTYAWGLNQDSGDPGTSDAVDPDTVDTSVIAVRVRVTYRGEDGALVTEYYGCSPTENPSAAPEAVSLVQAVRRTMAKSTAADKVTAYGIAADSVSLSGVMAEIDLSDAVSPSITLTSAAEQNFNTWVAMSDDFAESSYSDSMVYARTDFDARTGIDETSGDYAVLGGWYPDDGPFAGDVVLEDSFEVGREGVGASKALFYPGTATDAGRHFASWGASHAEALPYYLMKDGSSYDYRTENMVLGPGAELLLSRTTPSDSDNRWQPDALVRLRSNTILGPNYSDDAAVKLNGIGEVSFALAMSIPYSLQDRIALYPMNEGATALTLARGVQTTVRLPTQPSSRLSGYSVSLYLVTTGSASAANTVYELRLSQILDFSASDAQRPSNRLIGELYRWNNSGTAPVATRLPLEGGSEYYATNTSLPGATVSLWVGADGKLRAGINPNSQTGVTSATLTSRDTVIANPASASLSVALGSAECLPAFDRLQYSKSPADTLTSSSWTPFNATETLAVGGNPWTWSTTENNAMLTVSRNRPAGETSGVLLIETVDNGLVVRRQSVTVSAAERKTFSAVLGATNVQLQIRPQDGSNVLIDDIRVSSWCGDDSRRNGAYVPDYTDPGFPNVTGKTGFAAVGVWVTPKNAAEISGPASSYSGDQVMLLQYSRRNESCGREFTLGGVKTTHHGLAVYMPYTNNGCGAVNLRYMIPTLNPATQQRNPDVDVILQYVSTTSYVQDFLNTPGGPFNEWNLACTTVKRLPVTDGEWRTAAIVPDALPNENGRPFSGYIRLVMVTTERGDQDPMVYLDQIFVTQQTTDLSSVWYGTNTKLTSTPADLLYWKDREPNSRETRETPFAERSRLTPAMQFNDSSRADGAASGEAFEVTALDSPRLDKGIGTVTFAARRLEAGSPVRVYLAVSTDPEDVLREDRTYKPVWSGEVRGTVWEAFTVDMTAIETYLDGTTAFDYGSARYLRLMVGQRDRSAAVPDVEDSSAYTGRILVDRVTVADPVTPTVDVASIDFVNSADAEFDSRHSPLSQPVHGASDIRVRVTLEPYDAARIAPDSLHVFLSCRVSNPDGTELTRHTAGFSYTDVLGNTVSASEDAPVYAWNDPSAWPLGAWLQTPDALGFDPETEAVSDLVPGAYTVRLTREGDAGLLIYVGTLPAEIREAAGVNALVRYGAWTSYETIDEAGVRKRRPPRKMTSASYKEFPWYFPRNLNAEIRTRYNADPNVSETVGSEFFSPYFWVYDTLPGEVFLNEINLRDGNVPKETREHAFVEVCAPAETSLAGWRLGMTAGTQTDLSVDRAIPAADAEGGKLPLPDAGVVPVQQVAGTASDRAFHTFFAGSPTFYYRGADATQEQDAATGASRNAGIGTEMSDFSLLDRRTAANSVLLFRPTGGAEHIVVYSNGDKSVAMKTLSAEVDKLTGYYRSAYLANGFDSDPTSDSPWSQTFASGAWKDQFGETRPAWAEKATGARLVSVVQTPEATAGDSTDAGDYVLDFTGGDTASVYANSISTLDMGSVWTRADNAVNAKADLGPTDLTELFQETWPGYNPTEQARSTDGSKTIRVTPRQVNVGQYMLRYEGLQQIGVTSDIVGFGSHALVVGDTAEETRFGGMKKRTWSVPETTVGLKLTYTPAVYHTLGQLTVTFVDRETRTPVTDEAVIGELLGSEWVQGVDPATGLVTVNVPASAETDGVVTVPFRVSRTDAASGETLTYNPTFTATFTVASEADGGITSVRTYCGDGDELPGYAKYQPWWGSAFGFEVRYREGEGVAAAAQPTGVLVVFPNGPAKLPAGSVWDPNGDDFTWAGLSAMAGKTLDEALAWLADTEADGGVTAGARFVRIDGAAAGRIASANVMPMLGHAYEAEPGNPKEPAVPYVVWGIYTDTAPNAAGGTDSVTFVLPQKFDGSVFRKPDWYRGPGYTLNNAGIPYFHLYSTPPQSAWLSELSLDGADAFVEVAMPKLREALLNAGVPETVPAAWKVGFYGADGTEAAGSVPLDPATETESGSVSYRYRVVKIGERTLVNPTAAVLVRPAGIVEGGVWTKTSGTPGEAVAVPEGAAEWLVPASDTLSDDGTAVATYGSYIFPGVADGPAGSVQLVGQTVLVNDIACLSSDASKRDQWAYLAATEGGDNGEPSVPPEPPAWNQVTLVSRMRNTVAGFSASECGYWIDGLFVDANSGTAGSEEYRRTRDGAEWVYDRSKFSLSYRNRKGYSFSSITIPQDMVGRVMLFGGTERIASADELARRVAEYRTLAESAPSEEAREGVKRSTWLSMGNLCDVDADTGTVTFRSDTVFDTAENITFADLENFYVTLVIVDEPLSAVSEINVFMTRGATVPGLWLATQSFYGLTADGSADAAKGGSVASDPIWSDETGTVSGQYRNVHGWVYQPVVGDALGMTAVIVPEDGLTANVGMTPEDLRARLAGQENSKTSVRPFLVWNVIPASKVTTDAGSDAAADFFTSWSSEVWLGRDPRTVSLTQLRTTLKAVSGSLNGAYSKAGIVPLMADTDRTDPDTVRNAIFFRAMTQAEFDAAVAAAADTGLSAAADETLVPFERCIRLENEVGRRDWADGSVLRFAIVVADARTGTVYDWQSVSNFSNTALPVYCPWYLPAATADLNTMSQERGRGTSPYAWIYEVPQGVAWLNEFRPFRGTADNTAPAFELAMHRSPLIGDSGAPYPQWSLNGWELVLQKAELPLLKVAYVPGEQEYDYAMAELDGTLEWQDAGTVSLYGWIPASRLGYEPPAEGSGAVDMWGGLEFYPITSDAAALTRDSSEIDWIAYNGSSDGTSTVDSFNYLRITDTAFLRQAPEGAYEKGVIYALSLRRNNGVVEDRVLFYTEPTEKDPFYSHWAARMTAATAAENGGFSAVGKVRSMATQPVMESDGVATAQFLRDTVYPDDATRFYWLTDPNEKKIRTLSGPNMLDANIHAQPYSSYTAAVINAYYTLGAQIQGGGEARLDMSLNGVSCTDGASGMAFATALSGSAYSLRVSGWNSDWFRFAGATCNGQTVSVTPAKTYVSAGLGTLSASDSLTIDGSLEGNTEYVISFLYTDAARRLAEAGVMAGSDDDGFLQWLMQVAPDAVTAMQDGVTAAEKYWIGLDNAAVDASDVELRVRSVAFDTANGGTDGSAALSSFVFSFTKGGEPITALQGDGRLVLLGKTELDEPWRFVRALEPAAFVDGVYVIDTDCRFFKAVLISVKEADALR